MGNRSTGSRRGRNGRREWETAPRAPAGEKTVGGAGNGADGGGAAGLAAPDPTAARMSLLLMRPPAPLPSPEARSTLCSLASFRTSCEVAIFCALPHVR